MKNMEITRIQTQNQIYQDLVDVGVTTGCLV